MKILVTGGAGFIASHVVDRYISQGHQVVVIDNLYSGKVENINPKAKFYQLDITDKNIIDIFKEEKFDILSHHAAQMDVRLSVADPTFDANVNILGGINLYEACVKTNVKKVIFASSGGTVYGEKKDLPSKETDELDPISPYGISKMANEKYLYYYKEAYNLDYTILRYSNVFGPRQNPKGEAGIIAIFIDKMLNNDQTVINGDGTITRDYIYISDAVEVNSLVLNKNLSGIFNVASQTETDINTIFDTLFQKIKPNIQKFNGPAKIGDQKRSLCSIEKLNELCNWSPAVDFTKGIDLTVEYYKQQQQ